MFYGSDFNYFQTLTTHSLLVLYGFDWNRNNLFNLTCDSLQFLVPPSATSWTSLIFMCSISAVFVFSTHVMFLFTFSRACISRLLYGAINNRDLCRKLVIRPVYVTESNGDSSQRLILKDIGLNRVL